MKFTRRQALKLTASGLVVAAAPMAGMASALKGETLPTRPIPGTNESLPIVGFGNSQAFREGNRELSSELVAILREFGGRYIDAFGASRILLGELASAGKFLDELFLGSNVRSDDEVGVREETRQFMKADGGDRPLDLVLSTDIANFASRADDFRRLKEEGLARYVGVARHRAEYHGEMIALIEAGVVDFVQVNYSLLEPEAEQRLLLTAMDKGVAILVNRPFANGEWFPRVKGRELPAWASEFDCHSWAQFSLKFILSNPAVTCVLTETSKPHHARDNLSGGLGQLPNAAMRERMRSWVSQL